MFMGPWDSLTPSPPISEGVCEPFFFKFGEVIAQSLHGERGISSCTVLRKSLVWAPGLGPKALVPESVRGHALAGATCLKLHLEQ